MNMVRKIFLMLFFILMTLEAFAQVTFESHVNKKVAKENDLIELTVMCIGGNLDYEPEIPNLNDFDIVGQSSSNQMQIINGNIISSESYIYKLVPKRKGKLIIPSIIGYINNNKYETKAIQIEIEGDNKKEKIEDDKIVYLKAEISNKEVFLNEQFTYTLKFYRRVNTEKNDLTMPDFKDFIIEDLGKQKDYQTNINGKIYAVTEIKKILIPNKTGIIKIPSSKLLVEIPYKDENDFWGSSIRKETKNLKSQEFEIKVKNLPNNLSEIVSNKIDYEINISKKEINLGDSIDLKIKFKGQGNIYDIELEKININDSKVYQDKTNTKNFVKDEKLFSEKTFNYGIVPLKSGKININFPKIIYFNTNKKNYEYLNINPLEINVTENKKKLQNDQNLVNNEENKEIKINNNTNENDNTNTYKILIIIIIFLILIIIAFIFFLIFKQKKKNFEEKITVTQDNKTNQFEYKNLNSEDFEEVYKTFMKFIKNNKIPDDKLKEFNKLEEKFYKIKFSNNYNEYDKKELIKKANELINIILENK